MNRLNKKYVKYVIGSITSFFLILVVSSLLYFPGQQSIMSVVLATGVNKSYLQERVDQIEDKVIQKKVLNQNEKRFLFDLYTCFWKGAKLTYIFRQSSQLMRHYMSCSGETLKIEPRIFIHSRNVDAVKKSMIEKIIADTSSTGINSKLYKSKRFHMSDPTFYDSVTGLSYGTLSANIISANKHKISIKWVADHPWKWPTFDSFNNYFEPISSHDFPLPNLMSIFFGKKHALFINDGLGAYIVNLGLAKPFHAFSEWHETIDL